MADVERPFHLFSKLPAELRLCIWRECLPRRVCELDIPQAHIVFTLPYNVPSFCKLYRASRLNACPPAISRVCRESRRVAFETGRYTENWENVPEDTRWSSWNSWSGTRWWRDSARDSAHLNWTPSYEADFESVGDPMKFLAWHTARMSARCSLMEDSIVDGDSYAMMKPSLPAITHNPRPLSPLRAAELEALKRLPSCLVVMRVVIIHADLESAAPTGLFGILGDAHVQIVDAADNKRVDALFDLAEKSERKYAVTLGQDFHRSSTESFKQKLKDLLWEKYSSEDLILSMRPAYMFRLCTAFCNQVGRKEPDGPLPVQDLGRG